MLNHFSDLIKARVHHLYATVSLRHKLLAGLILISCFQLSGQQRKNRPNIEGPQGLQINSFTGSVYFERQDFFIPGSGDLPMDFTFAYTSSKCKENWGYGNGWVFTYGMEYGVDSNNVTSVMFSDGAYRRFIPNGPVYDPFPGVFDDWAEYATGKFRMTSTDGMKYFFDEPSHQKLTAVEDRNGNKITLTYSDSLLISVSDLTGRTINLTWTNGLLTSLSHQIVAQTRTYQYQYDNNQNLVRVINPKNCDIVYEYTDQNKLTTILDENKNPLHIYYAPSGAARNIISCVSAMSITYNRAQAKTYTVEEVGDKRIATEYAYDDEGKILYKEGNCCGFAVGYVYDDNDNIISRQDGGGHFTTYEYDANGNVTRETDAYGNSRTFSYEPVFSNLTFETDKRGNTTYYAYDTEGNLIQKAQPLGVVESFTWDANGNMLTYTNGRMHTTTYTYDIFGNILTVEDPEGGLTTFTYDGLGNKLTMIDPNDNLFTFTYDAMDQLLSVTDPYLHQMTYTYDCRNNKMTETDANNHTTSYIYDALDRQIMVVTAEGIELEYAHDAMGNLEKLINGKGNTTTYEYNVRGQIIAETDALGYTAYTEYNACGNKTSYTDQAGNTSTFVHDDLNRLLSTTDPLGGTTTHTYDPNGNVVQVTNALGNSVRLEYDALNRLVKEIDPLNFQVVYTYDAANNMISKKDRNNNTWTYAYDANNRKITETDPLSNTIVSTYDPNGNLLTKKDREDQTMTYSYDDLDRKLTETNTEGEATSYVYDPAGNVLSITFANGRVVTYVYDADNRMLSESDNIGTFVAYTYDLNNNVMTETDGSSHTKTYEYDAMDRLKTLTDALGNSVHYTYDANSSLVSVTDKNGNITTHTYDALNRNTQISDAQGKLTTYTFDALGNQTSITDSEGRLTTMTYNALNKLSEEIMPDGSSRMYTYDGNTNVVSRKDYNGTTINYVYNALDRMIEKDFPSGPSATFTYDRIGKMLTAVNANANLSFTYDDANRLLTETLNGKTITYTYDIAARQRSMTYPGGMVVEEQYDFRDRITSVDANSTEVVSYGYTPANLMASKNYGNGTTTTYTYDVVNQLISIAVSPGMPIGFNYTYDDEGNRLTSENLHQPTRSEQYNYDPLNRLQSMVIGNLSGGVIPMPSGSSDFNYDALGNRTSVMENGNTTTYTTNSLNQYTAITAGATVNPTYQNGDVMHDGMHGYAYDHEHRITAVDGGSTATYKYDALGRRIEKNVGGVITRFYYNDRQVIEERNGADAVIATYVASPSVDDHIAVFRNSTTYYFHHNAIGSVAGMSDASGNIVEHYEYDPYGKPRFYDASYTEIGATAIGNHYLFTGREYDAETGLYFFHARYYHPGIGRFLQRDPAGLVDGMNLYQYVNSNPIGWIDPDGLKCQRDALRKEVALPGFVSGITKRLGLRKVKMKLHGEIRRCTRCCEETKSEGRSVSASLGILVEAEFGSPEFDFWVIKVRLGWYARINVTGSLSGGKDQCGKAFGGGCVGLGGEFGLIGEIIVGAAGKGASGGARGGINVSGRVCMVCTSSGCKIKANVCGALRARVFAKVDLPWIGKVEYFHEWETDQLCTGEIPIGEIGA